MSVSAALVVSCCVGSACGGAQAMTTATEMPTGPRRPDGVLIEPEPAIPPPQDRSAARGVVALREPLASQAVEDVVRAYVRAFEREDIDGLGQLLTADAGPLDAAHGSADKLLDLWRTRMRNFEYQKLAGTEIARIDRIERFSFDNLGGLGAPPRPPEMRPGDLLVKVPIATPRIGSDQLFGEVVVLLLRREDGRLRIAGVGEENAN